MKRETSYKIIIFFIPLLLLQIIPACDKSKEKVIVYVSVDQNYSEQIIKKFENETGIDVLPVYDIESNKTTGLVNRIIAEKNNPVADVFWSGEFVQTILLKEQDLLEEYISKNAELIPENYKDLDGFWTGFSGRARVIIVNNELLREEQYPSSIFDILNFDIDPDNKAIAYPLFGTTYTHAASIYALLGAEKAKQFFSEIKSRGIRILDGNGSVRDFAASGKIVFGLTDTDDACSAIKIGKPVSLIIPDQNSFGTLVIPNTIAKIKGGSNSENANKFIDFILSPETLNEFISTGWCHVPIRQTNIKPDCIDDSEIIKMNLSLYKIYENLDYAKKDLQEIFIR